MGSKARWLVGLLPLCFLGLLFWAAWSRDPDFWRSTPGLHHLAQEAAARGDRARALDLARKVRSREPRNSYYAVFLGQMYLQSGQPRGALEIGRQVAAEHPGTQVAKLQAQALEQLGERQAALEVLAAHLQRQPEDREILETAAALAADRPETHPLAVTYYERLYRLSGDPLARRHLVDLLASLNRFQEAIPIQEEEVAQFPENRESLHQLALLYYWQRDYQASTRIYQRLLEKAAGDAGLRLEAAKSAEAAQDLDQALTQYLWLYGHHGAKQEYALALARLWDRKGNHVEAAGILAPLMADQPSLELRRWYALELLLVGDFAKALKTYQAAWEAGDSNQETVVNLARLHARERRFAKAAAFWDEASRRQLLQGDLRWEAALTYSYARRYQDALAAVEPLRRRDSQDPRLLLFCGQLHFYQKQWGPAARQFTSYLEKRPQDVEVRRQLAEALSFGPETRGQAVVQYGEVLKVQDNITIRLRRISLLLEDQRLDEAARELQDCPTPEEPRLLRQQAHLFLWLGDLEGALQRYDLFLQKEPHDPGARLEKARVLTYLRRGPEALELLNRLRQDQPQDQVVRVAAIEAYLTAKDYPKALSLAQKELEPLPDLNLDERALVARCYYHSQDPRHLHRAVELLLTNLRRDRYHHPSLLILASVLPRLPRYQDLNHVMNRLPGIRVGGPEQAAALAYFDGQAGRQGGKLNYLLHVLEEYRRHKWPRSPGEVLGLAWLALELDNQAAAARYYRRALELRPRDRSISNLLLQCQLAQKHWGQALASLEKERDNPRAPLKMARLYLKRHQFEGVKAMVARIPENSPDRTSALLLLAQAYRGEQNYPEARRTLKLLEGRLPREEYLMEQARTLEGMGDRSAVALYDEIIATQADSQMARVARARRSRARGNWGAAYQDYARALKEAPQDLELLDELEGVRQQMRPQMASRGFPESRGERRPEEVQRPWQFSRFGREPGGLGLSNYLPAFVSDVLPIVQPESLYLTDSNKLHGWIFRVSGGFWITKVLPVQLAMEYREYHQNSSGVKQGMLDLGLYRVYDQSTQAASRLRRAEVSLGLGPLSLGDRLRLSGELILRRYWKRTDWNVVQPGLQREEEPFPVPHFIYYNTTRNFKYTTTDNQNRLLGSLAASMSLGPRTDVTLRYSRRDIFDQEAYLFPRLYQSVLNLAEVPTVTYHQADLSYNHQFRPGLDYRGNIGGAFFSDQNRRLTLYQGLAWQALRQPRMQLEVSPHYYLAAYSQRHRAYFSPYAYHAIGLGLDFHRQIFRLPTLILQGTLQGVGQHGDWGPALQGLAALEWEFVQNFYADVHVFYFREWVDNYRLFTAGVSFRWRF